MNKLLSKTQYYYMIFAMSGLILSTPFFYWISTKIFAEEVDEVIFSLKKDFFNNEKYSLKKKEIISWNRLNQNIKILPDTVTQQKDKVIQYFFYDIKEKEYEPYRVLFSPVKIEGQAYVVMFRMNMLESEDLIISIAFLYILVFGILMVILLVFSRYFTKKLWAPFYQSLSLLKTFNLKANDLPFFEPTNILEFQELNVTLENLLSQNLTIYRSQKEFSENASHELQTPISIFKSKLDLMLQTEDLTPEQSEILEELYSATKRLDGINKNLLLLSKIEHQQYSDKEEVAIGKMVTAVLPYFKEQAIDKNIQITIEMADDLIVFANKTLTEVLVHNLLLNAIKHNRENGHVSITTGKNFFSISNVGDKDPLNREKMYNRFSNVRDSSIGSGLGLSIVKKITQLNNWEITYSFNKDEHTFRVYIG